jgi:peptidoglycan hydrolase CwlO-like protein
MGSSQRVPRGVLVAFVAALFVLPGAGAFARAPSSPAAQLAELKQEIKATERDVQRLTTELMAVAAAVTREEAEYEQILIEVDRQRSGLDAARLAYEEARRRLDQRVRTVYMDGPATAFGAVFGSATLSDLALVMEIQDRVAEQDGALADRTGRLERAAADSEWTVSQTMSRQSRLLADLDRQRVKLAQTFVEQQRLLTELTASRRELNRMVRETAGPDPGQGPAGMTISFGEWAGHFLRRLGTPDCRNNRVAVVAWETAEYTQARWNPLATTYGMAGATNFNSVGVKNYRSLEQGLDATVSTLLLGVRAYGYGAIIAGLAECAEPEVTAAAINASDWCHGCAGGNYVVQLIPAVEEYFDSYAR